MVTKKTKGEIATLREGGKRLAQILKAVADEVRPGASTAFLNEFAEKLIAQGGDKAAFLDYKPRSAKRPYPASLCVSVNHEVVHGIPNEKPRILKEGDVVSLDLGLVHKGLITDHALTVIAGTTSKEVQKLVDVTRKALYVGIREAKPGNKTGDIGYAIEKYVRRFKYGIVEELAGHGVGYSVHEDPFVPNFGVRGQGVLLEPGMVIAIEPMVTMGSGEIRQLHDGYTIVTADGSISAHFEHTIVITDDGAEILTV